MPSEPSTDPAERAAKARRARCILWSVAAVFIAAPILLYLLRR